MRATVTGSSGHVGTNLVQRLLADGWTVATVDRRPPEIPEGTFVEHHQADVCNRDALQRAFEGSDVVFHVAARISLLEDDPEVWRVNVTGSATAAEAALQVGVAKFVQCSSVHAFDLYRNDSIDEEAVRSVDPSLPVYDRSKAAAEVEVRRVIDDGLDAVIVNPTAIIGPADPIPSRVGGVIRSAARGRMPAVVEGGFDWVDVRDVVAGLLAAGERGRTAENYLLSGHPATALDLARLAAKANNRRGPRFALPLSMMRTVAPVLGRVALRFGSDALTPAAFGALASEPVVSNEKAAKELDYDPRPLAETVEDLVRWFREAGRL